MDSYPTPNMNPPPTIPKSTTSSQQQKQPSPPKNPFISSVEE